MEEPKREFLISKEILKTIDPMIKRLVVMINSLSFVKQTHFSCSGDYEKGESEGSPYIIIEYYSNDDFTKVINSFHKDILRDKNIVEFRSEHYFKSMFKLLSPIKLKKVQYNFHIFEMHSFDSFSEFTQKTIEREYGYKPKEVPWPKHVDRKHAIKSWQHFYRVVENYLVNYQK